MPNIDDLITYNAAPVPSTIVTSYLWELPSGGGTIIGSAASASVQVKWGLTTGTYSLKCTLDNNCSGSQFLTKPIVLQSGGRVDGDGWGGYRTIEERGLIKDNRFPSAQYIYANNGTIIDTTVDISVTKLIQGFLHDNNWNNLRGHSYKRWKVGSADFRTEPLIDIPINPLFTGKQIAVTVYYFNSMGIIQEQYQEFIQL